MEFIHKVVYINLDRRTDRRGEIENEFRRMEIEAERFPAIDRKPGIIGCGASHLAVLKRARDEGWPNVLILEDDFNFIVDASTLDHNLRTFFTSNTPYDVLMLSYSVNESEPLNETVSYARDVQTASGYVVNQSFYNTLINTWEWALDNLITTGQHWLYANDQSWKSLQKKHSFLYFNQRIGVQRASFTDNVDIDRESFFVDPAGRY